MIKYAVLPLLSGLAAASVSVLVCKAVDACKTCCVARSALFVRSQSRVTGYTAHLFTLLFWTYSANVHLTVHKHK